MTGARYFEETSMPAEVIFVLASMEARPLWISRQAIQISRLLQKDAEQESQMRSEIQNMKQELSTISMMDEFARYARLERKINKMTDKLKTHVKTRTAQLAKIKWVINIVFYILQAALMISLIWKYYSEPVTVLPSKWLAPLERLVAFPTGVAGGVGITCWLVVCNKVVAIMLHPFS
ncbi:tail-anchored protein insertion receptor WRB isoform X2 [Lacerta agilis]|uniref:tail-anchored protein insertion receptor WRB isoform X2 n=1 Tax=Lacerta agilis TaxID=80427 RepID=UPI00141A3E65|nr:tail-anchored protein insertion receptor WRB isoform X2 [Lacerta agilis]